MIEVVMTQMSNRLLHTPCGIGAAPLIFASVCIAILICDECCVHRQPAGTIWIRFCGAIAFADGKFRFIVSEPSRRVDNVFKPLEIYVLEISVHIRKIYVAFDKRFVVGKGKGRYLTMSWSLKVWVMLLLTLACG